MQYIKVSNDGVLNVPVACNMLGASVKTGNDAIGMFGSGLKYALAQACRMKLEIHIASGENIFIVETRPQEFRERIFDKVILRNIFTGEIHDTPITTEFGSHDWTDPWFVYREIVCNAMDEPGFRKSIVSDLRRARSETSIYLRYDDFRQYHEHHAKYFSEKKGMWIKPGKGRVFKRGVKVGTINGINLDWQDDSVIISESRDVNEWDALWRLGHSLNGCENAGVWEHFIQSEKRDKVYLNIFSENVRKAFNIGCRRAFGEYAIAPDVADIKNDLCAIGCHPLVVPTGWTLPENLPRYTDKISLDSSDRVRNPNADEEELLDWGLRRASAFGINTDVVIKIFSSDKAVAGLEKNGTILLKDSSFKDKRSFLITLFHELGHSESGAGDYDRQFSSYFIEKIVDFILE